MAEEPVEITYSNVLVVEGKDDQHFFEALATHLQSERFQVIDIEGKTNLRARLEALTLSRGFTAVTSLGIARDANADASAAFQSVCDALRAVNLPVPARPLVPTGHQPRVTVMILPGEGASGMLEDLCLKAVEADPAMACVEQYLECLQQQGLALPLNPPKAKVQAFLASRPRAGLAFGIAALAGYWPFDDDAFEQVRNFVQQVAS